MKSVFRVPVFIISMFMIFSVTNASDYKNGIHLINQDTIQHRIEYFCGFITTRLCYRHDSLPSNNLLSIHSRMNETNRKKIEIIPREKNALIEAIVNPGVELECLCTLPTKVKVDSLEFKKIEDGQVLVIVSKDSIYTLPNLVQAEIVNEIDFVKENKVSE